MKISENMGNRRNRRESGCRLLSIVWGLSLFNLKSSLGVLSELSELERRTADMAHVHRSSLSVPLRSRLGVSLANSLPTTRLDPYVFLLLSLAVTDCLLPKQTELL